MATIHFIYPHADRISAPDAIGRHITAGLSRWHTVINHNWDEFTDLVPGSNDVLLGHAHPAPGTIFRRNMRRPGWRRVIALEPYHHGDAGQMAFFDRIIPFCDCFLAITGNFWFRGIAESRFSHWLPRMRHVDLAVDRADFPFIKSSFAEAGRRRFLYIGHSGWTKNTGYLAALAREVREMEFGWIGSGRPIRGFHSLGRRDFRDPVARAEVATYDFLLTVGRADANPTTILEAMAWGLIPACTPQSGYVNYPGIINIPLDNLGVAVGMLRSLQHVCSLRLQQLQQENLRLLDTHFNWPRLIAEVHDAISATGRPPLRVPSMRRTVALRVAEAVSPYSPMRPMNLIVTGSKWLRSLYANASRR